MESLKQDQEAFNYQVHHIFLPPKLPQEDDFTEPRDRGLIDGVLEAMERFKSYLALPEVTQFQKAIDMITTMRSMRPNLHLDIKKVAGALKDLGDGGITPFKLLMVSTISSFCLQVAVIRDPTLLIQFDQEISCSRYKHRTLVYLLAGMGALSVSSSSSFSLKTSKF